MKTEQGAQLTQAMLKELLHYHPESGIFRWRQARKNNSIPPWSVAGSMDGRGYIQINIAKKRWKAHRLAWVYMTGQHPPGEIDHINGVRTQNDWLNLRHASHKQNGENIKQRSDNTSGFRGVCFDKRSKRWLAKVQHHQTQYNLGYFDTAEKAADVVRAKRAELFTHDHGRSV